MNSASASGLELEAHASFGAGFEVTAGSARDVEPRSSSRPAESTSDRFEPPDLRGVILLRIEQVVIFRELAIHR
jgi:hypothetical protein